MSNKDTSELPDAFRQGEEKMEVFTMGQAVDRAVEQHHGRYPESDVYDASVAEVPHDHSSWRVEVRAAHFSVVLVYVVRRDGVVVAS